VLQSVSESRTIVKNKIRYLAAATLLYQVGAWDQIKGSITRIEVVFEETNSIRVSRSFSGTHALKKRDFKLMNEAPTWEMPSPPSRVVCVGGGGGGGWGGGGGCVPKNAAKRRQDRGADLRSLPERPWRVRVNIKGVSI